MHMIMKTEQSFFIRGAVIVSLIYCLISFRCISVYVNYL